MKDFFEQSQTLECPMIPIRGVVAFPNIPISIELERKISIKAFEEANLNDKPVLLLTQKNMLDKNPGKEGFYPVGTVCRVTQSVRLASGNVRIVVNGFARAEVNGLERDGSDSVWHAKCVVNVVLGDNKAETDVLKEECKEVLREYLTYLPEVSPNLISDIEKIGDGGYFADFVAANLIPSYEEKIKILIESEPFERLKRLTVLMGEQLEFEKLRKEIHGKVKASMDKNQKEYYLNEQIKVMKNELGDDSDSEADIEKYREKIFSLKLGDESEEKLLKEVTKLSKIPVNSAEYGVICNYLDVCIDIPWNEKTKDRIDIKKAAQILDRDHTGLEKVKERILEYLAVKKLAKNAGNQIICLVGPPGTGKTSIAKSIAESMNRKYVRVSLGGVRDESDIRGHRKTYIGSMPGRVITGLTRAKSKNPVMLLDEIDKMSNDMRGDPSAALMEVLDSEQNRAFRDHFVELAVDLSEVMFIATANTLETISRPLLDRMEIIELKSYSNGEKMQIVKNHLLSKQIKRHGLGDKNFSISDDAVLEVINYYTHEAGVRNLEREIASLCRKVARLMVEDKKVKKVEITLEDIKKYLGVRKVMPEEISAENEVGVVNGLAYTELGGALLKVEVAAVPGTGKLELTGSLGNVMKESAKAALTYIRSRSSEWQIDDKFYKEKDIHIHFPEGAVPKDGPSAGVTVVSALVSELSGKPVKNTVAMTGEVTLRGKVLPIGGLKEKTMAAYKAGVKTVLIPKDNEKDLEEIDKTVKAELKFIPCVTVDDVLRNAIVN